MALGSHARTILVSRAKGDMSLGEGWRGGCTDNKVREGPFQSLAIALEEECKIVRH